LSESNTAPKPKTKTQKAAKDQGADFIDVEAYLDDDDKGKDVKTSLLLDEQKRSKDAEANAPLSNP